ncbi:hypothetical protein AYI69_g6667 [Smittium culicis]|uniref:Uncharacterized protein n=1 Tax=Smittium culicis TaxID=133412 RepID=A0A1R1XXP1_9FUNG|nr:hypothetical protein AYI69_g6667 [Smittium culicis]
MLKNFSYRFFNIPKLIASRLVVLSIFTTIVFLIHILFSYNAFDLKKSQVEDRLSKINPINKKSWKINDLKIKEMSFIHEENKVNTIKLPKEYYGPAKVVDIIDEYQIMVPITTQESITFLNNMYSDMNILTFCDKDDGRNGCDIVSKNKYQYSTLTKKTFDMFNYTCNNLKKYKVYAKMDFDAYVDKSYIHGVLKFMADNSDKYIYYGNPILRNGNVFNGGNFYALSGAAFEEYCSCNLLSPDYYTEDQWFGDAVRLCLKEKHPEKPIYYMLNDMDKVLHKEYKDIGVDVKLGRKINQP